MNELATVADFVAKLGPTGILGICLYILAKRYAALETALQTSQNARIQAAENYAQEKRQDSKEGATALLAIADRTNQTIDKVEELVRTQR